MVKLSKAQLVERLKSAECERDEARRGQCLLQQRWLVCHDKAMPALHTIAAEWWGVETATALFPEADPP